MEILIDLSHPIMNLMPVYPGDEPPQLEKINDFAQDGFNNFRLSTSMHTATHIDGPMHLTQCRQFISEIPIEQLVGVGCLLNVVDEEVIQSKPEYESFIEPNSIILLHTGFSRKFGKEEYYRNYPTVSLELAQVFVRKHIKMLCIDSPSPDRYPHEVHKLLLENSVLIGENLTNLEKLLAIKKFEVIALPLKIQADSSPARIIARISK
jgi:kynurenine formamidase